MLQLPQSLNMMEKNWAAIPLPDGELHYMYDMEPLTLATCKGLRDCKLTWHDYACRSGKGANATMAQFPCPAAAGQQVARSPDKVGWGAGAWYPCVVPGNHMWCTTGVTGQHGMV
jgi:hypothetical protein